MPDPTARARLLEWMVRGEPPRPRDHVEAARLLEAAREQGLIGLLHSVVAGGSPDWPEETRQRLADAARAALVRGATQLDLMARLAETLAAHGLRVLPMKGAALAESLYGSVAERPMADVDALALDDWDATVAVLGQAGFALVEKADHAWALREASSGEMLELHHSVTSCPGFFPVDVPGLWARSREAKGQVPRVPSPEDLLVQLSVHAAFQHGLVLALVHYLDFRRLVEGSRIDLGRLRDVAAHARGEACVVAALRAAGVVAGGSALEPLAAALESALAPALARWIGTRVGDPRALIVPARPDLARMRWALAAGRRADFIARTLASPGPDRPKGAWSRAVGVVRRGGRLAWRWGRHGFA